MEDGRCRLGLAGRLELVRRIEAGESQRAADRWWHRWLEATPGERASRECLRARPRRPRSCPWQLAPADEQLILRARRRTNYGPARLQGSVGAIARRSGRSCAATAVRAFAAQSRARANAAMSGLSPGARLHNDAKSRPRFARPGHWAHGDRSDRGRGLGSLCVISVVDDHSRLAYSELHAGENQHSTTATLRRAAAWMTEQGCGPPEAVMSDNHKAYGSDRFQAALAALGARHILTPPYTPRWNGKVERLQQTLDLEWAHSQVWPSSLARDKALRSFLRYYNRRRPHTSLGDRPPISRVHQERRQGS